MEIIIGLLVLCGALWWFFIRKEDKPQVSAPYKVETPPTVGKPADDIVETPAPVVAPTKAKAPAKPKAAAKPKATAKAKAPAKPKAPKAKPTNQA